MNPNHLNIHIVDDDKAVRDSIRALLGNHLEGCALQTFASGEAFLDNANLHAGGVVVLDYIMESMTGLEVHQKLVDLHSPLVVVFLSGKGDIPDAVRAMSKGAVSWLQKPCSDAQLLQTVQAAHAQAQQIAVVRRDQQNGRRKWDKLSLREKQAAFVTAGGHTSKEAGQILERRHPEFPIKFRTIESHRAKVFAKLEVNNSNELLLFLQKSGLWEEARSSLDQRPGRDPD